MCESCDYPRLLAEAGLRATPRRLAVLDCLGRAGRPLSAGEVHRRVRPRQPLDRVTAYRVLEDLGRAGLVARIEAGPRGRRYHLLNPPRHPAHPHFYCTVCGRLLCLEAGVVKLDLARLAGEFPARVENLSVSLEGVCPQCLARQGG